MPAHRLALPAGSLFFLAGCGSSTISGGSKATSRPSTASVRTSAKTPSGTVQSTDGRFQTVIPAGFVDATNSVQSGVANAQYLAVGPRRHGFATNINVLREPAQGRGDMDQIVALELATIKRLAPQAGGLSKVTRLTVGGEPARAVVYLNTPTGNRVLRQRQVFVVHGRWIYTITYSALPGAYGADVRALDTVTTAWRWLDSP